MNYFLAGEIAGEHQPWNPLELQPNLPYAQGGCSLPLKGLPEQNPISSSTSDSMGDFYKPLPANFELTDPFYLNAVKQEKEPGEEDHQKLHCNAQIGILQKDKSENGIAAMGTGSCPLVLKQPQLSGIQIDDSLKKVDSFSRWMAKELGEVEELHMHSNNGYSWSEIQTEDVVDNSGVPAQLQLDADTLNFSLSQDQLFSITEFSPNWAYSNLGTKVIIIGRYLKSDQEFMRCRWSCMFGKVEVSAMVLGEGFLCCDAPPHKSGLVPFYVTCSNRLACSEVREFEYRDGPQDSDFTDIPGGDMNAMHIYKRLERLLYMGPVGNINTCSENSEQRNDKVKKIISLMEEDENQRAKLVPGKDISPPKAIEEQQLEKSLKERFYEWLLQKVTEDGKGPSVLDDEGQGVLHLAAALGFNWALKPIIVSGVSIDFRDANGWTALHWAAFYGREDTVVALVSLGALCGALTDPSAEYPMCRTPADLASANGHKGISGFLAECSLTTHLSLLTVKESEEDKNTTEYSGAKAIQTVSERVASPISEEDVPESLSLKDSLAAVCNATQAAARIHQIYRIQSFQRKQLIEQVNDETSSEEHALSILAARTSRLGHNDVHAHAAAVSIQKKYRGWKKRKEFLIIRERIVKIQAHVRGHQARKKYKPIIWSVGILEKVILRWRRKGSGLRGFRHDAVPKGPSGQDMPQNEDDYDFLKEGRKQTEERMQKALSRVKSMVQYPEARAQYRRLLNVAEGLRETKDASHTVPGDSEHMSYPEEDLFDVENLLDDDTFMSIAFE